MLSDRKPSDIIQAYLANPSILTPEQLEELKLAVKQSRVNYSDGKARAKYDAALSRTADLLDALLLYFYLEPNNASKKINAILNHYEVLAGRKQNELKDKKLNTSDLSAEDLAYLSNSKVYLYNQLLRLINAANIFQVPVEASAEPGKRENSELISDVESERPTSTVTNLSTLQVKRQIGLKVYSLLNTSDKYYAAQHRFIHDMALTMSENFKAQISRLGISPEALNEQFCTAIKNQYRELLLDKADLSEALTADYESIKQRIALFKQQLYQDLGQAITYQESGSEKAYTSVAKTGLVDRRKYIDSENIAIYEDESKANTVVHIEITGVPQRTKLGKRILSDAILKDYRQLCQAVEVNIDADPVAIVVRDGFENKIPHWFTDEKLKLGKKILLVQMLKAAELHAASTVTELLLAFPQLEDPENLMIVQELQEQVFNEIIDTYERSPSNDGRDTPGVSSLSRSRSLYYKLSRNADGSEVFNLISKDLGGYYNFTNFGCPARAGTHLDDVDLNFVIQNILQDFPMRLLNYKAWLDEMFDTKAIIDGKAFDYTGLMYHYMSICLLSPSVSDDLLNGKYGADNNKTMANMASYAHQWLNYQVHNGNFLAIIKELIDFDSLTEEQKKFFENITVEFNTCIYGVNYAGQNSRWLGSNTLNISTGPLSVARHVCDQLKLFSNYYDYLRGYREPSSDASFARRFKQFTLKCERIISKLNINHGYTNIPTTIIEKIRYATEELEKLVAEDGRAALLELSTQFSAFGEYLYYLNSNKLTSWGTWFKSWGSSYKENQQLNLQQMRAVYAMLCYSAELRKAWCKSCHDRAQVVKVTLISIEIFKQQFGRFPQYDNATDIIHLADINVREIFIAQTPAMIRTTGGPKSNLYGIKSLVSEGPLPGVASRAVVDGGLKRLNQNPDKNHSEIDGKLAQTLSKFDDGKYVQSDEQSDEQAAIFIDIVSYINIAKLRKFIIKENPTDYPSEDLIDKVEFDKSLERYIPQIFDTHALEEWASSLSLTIVLDLNPKQLNTYFKPRPPGLNPIDHQLIIRYLLNNMDDDNLFDVTGLCVALTLLRPEGSEGCADRSSRRVTEPFIREVYDRGMAWEKNRDITINPIHYDDDFDSNDGGQKVVTDNQGDSVQQSPSKRNLKIKKEITVLRPINEDIVINEAISTAVIESKDDLINSVHHKVNSKFNVFFLQARNYYATVAINSSITRQILDYNPVMQDNDEPQWQAEQAADFQVKHFVVRLLEGRRNGMTSTVTLLINDFSWLSYAFLSGFVAAVVGYIAYTLINDSAWTLGSTAENHSNSDAAITCGQMGWCLTSWVFMQRHFDRLVEKFSVIDAQDKLGKLIVNSNNIVDIESGIQNPPKVVAANFLEGMKRQDNSRYMGKYRDDITPLIAEINNPEQLQMSCTYRLGSQSLVSLTWFVQALAATYGAYLIPSAVITIADASFVGVLQTVDASLAIILLMVVGYMVIQARPNAEARYQQLTGTMASLFSRVEPIKAIDGDVGSNPESSTSFSNTDVHYLN